MAISNALNVEIRRHLKYPLVGSPTNGMVTGTTGQAGGIIGFRYFEYMPLLEYRIRNISAEEEVALLGSQSQFFNAYWTAATAKITVTGTPVAGETPTVQINGQSSAYTTAVGDTATVVASQLAQALNVIPQLSPYIIAQSQAAVIALSSRSLGSQANTLTVLGFSTPSVTLAVTNAAMVAAVTMQGGQDPPGPVWLDPSQTISQPLFGYIPIIRYWESQITNAASGMDTLRADVFTQRQDELAARSGGYTMWCRRLAQYFAIPYGGAGIYDGSQPGRRLT